MLIVEEVDRLGFELISPNQTERRGGILTFRIPGMNNQALHGRLMEQQVVCAYRGGGIRFSPHFYNTDIDIREAFKRLSKLIATCSSG